MSSFSVTAGDYKVVVDNTETCKLLRSMEKADVLEMVNLVFQCHCKGNGGNKKLKCLKILFMLCAYLSA